MAGLAIARRTRSGMLVGPGFWMKVRPLTISKVSPFNARGVARFHQLHRVFVASPPNLELRYVLDAV